jgi:hypothetical protein
MKMITQDEKKLATQSDGTGQLNKLLPGLALVVIGLILLVGQMADSALIGVLIVPAIALVFIGWGIATREVGFLIPGGILAGIGIGTVALVYDWPFGAMSGDSEGGIFLLIFALGWASITLMSALFTDRVHWWPLIPSAVFATIGAALIIGGTAMEALVLIGYLWPFLLVLLGVVLLVRQAYPPRHSDQ